jgi:hypothetical protein
MIEKVDGKWEVKQHVPIDRLYFFGNFAYGINRVA